MTTPRHGFTELPTGQNASPESMNEAIRQLEQGANLYAVLDILNATPGSPTDGQCWLVGSSPTGQWSTDGAANKIAFRLGSAWWYVTPKEGDYADVADEDALYRYSGSAWSTFTISGSVSTTGSPSSGKLAKFSGASTITNGDLTGDVTTSGGLATTLANSGVSAATYGDATHVAQVAVDAKGRITSASNVAITAYVPGGTDVAVADGGTGVSTVPSNGQLLIGNGTGYTVASLTAGANVTITPSAGGITISSSITGGTVGDGDYGDITVTSSGTVYTIDPGVVTLAKIANASANSKLVGSGASGSGSSYSEITLGTNLSMSGTTLNATDSNTVVLISEQVSTGVEHTITFSSIPGTYKSLRLEVFGRTDEAVTISGLTITCNNDSSSIYDLQRIFTQNTSAGADQTLAGAGWTTAGQLPGSSAIADHPGGFVMELPTYVDTTFFKMMLFHGRVVNSTSTGNAFIVDGNGCYRSKTAISRIDIAVTTSAKIFVTGSRFRLYGIS